jgi:sulfotransferase family protein
MPRNILVVGMPRSGTSMTAGALAHAGYHVADEPNDHLRPGDAHNPGGYWEAVPLVEMNVEVLRAVGYPHHNTWLFDAITSEIAEKIDRLDPLPGHAEFVASWANSTPWVWKDPRFCYTLGYWWKLLDPAATGVFITKRDPTSIYRSFLRLGWRQPSAEAEADVRGRVNAHLAAAWRAIEAFDIPHIETSYDACLEYPDDTARIMSTFTGTTIEVDDLDANKRYDHSSLRGRLGTAADRLATAMPSGLRKVLKRLSPRGLLRAIFPARNGQ